MKSMQKKKNKRNLRDSLDVQRSLPRRCGVSEVLKNGKRKGWGSGSQERQQRLSRMYKLRLNYYAHHKRNVFKNLTCPSWHILC